MTQTKEFSYPSSDGVHTIHECHFALFLYSKNDVQHRGIFPFQRQFFRLCMHTSKCSTS